MTNLTLSQNLAANPLQVQYLSEADIPLALGLIASIKASGVLLQPYHLKDREEAELKQLSQDGYPLLGIKNSKGKLIAFATVSPNGDGGSFIIRSLCTSPEYEGHGCGKKMISAAIAWANEMGVTQLTAKVSSDNLVSRAIFSKARFTFGDLQWDSQKHYWYNMLALNLVSAHKYALDLPALTAAYP